MFSKIRFALLGCALAAFTGCSSSVERKDAGKEYDIEGKVTAIAADGAKVTIDHQAIPGLMKAMEMEFRAEAGALKDVKAGDAVKGKLRVKDGAYTILSLGSVSESSEAKEIRESLAKLSATDRALAEAQKLCPISGKPLGSMDVPTQVKLEGQTVFLCCDGCDARALTEPAKTLAKLKTLREKSKGDEK